jgi:hypothetical protein
LFIRRQRTTVRLKRPQTEAWRCSCQKSDCSPPVDENPVSGPLTTLPVPRAVLRRSSRVVYYAFDLLQLRGKGVMNELLTKRSELLKEKVLSKLNEPMRFSPDLDASLQDLIASVKAQGLEGLVARDATAPTSPASGPGPGRRCASTRGRSW